MSKEEVLYVWLIIALVATLVFTSIFSGTLYRENAALREQVKALTTAKIGPTTNTTGGVISTNGTITYRCTAEPSK